MDRRIIRRKTPAPHAEDGRTLQSETKGCDINLLLKRFEKTGTFTHIAKSMPTYGDFSSAQDYLGSLLQVKEAQRLFDEYPAELRAEFHNDPGEMLSFIDDPENEDRAIELGLVEAPVGYEAPKPADPEAPPPADPPPPPEA